MAKDRELVAGSQLAQAWAWQWELALVPSEPELVKAREEEQAIHRQKTHRARGSNAASLVLSQLCAPNALQVARGALIVSLPVSTCAVAACRASPADALCVVADASFRESSAPECEAFAVAACSAELAHIAPSQNW